MLKKMISAVFLTAFVAFGTPATAQFTDAAKQAGRATKGAVTSVEKGAKKVGTAGEKAVTGVPQGATGRCKDGTYTTAKMKNGACSHHGGIERWY